MDKSKGAFMKGTAALYMVVNMGRKIGPVVSGETQQKYLCESCGYDEIEFLDELKERVKVSQFTKEKFLRVLLDLRDNMLTWEWEEDYHESGLPTQEEWQQWSLDRLDAVIAKYK